MKGFMYNCYSFYESLDLFIIKQRVIFYYVENINIIQFEQV